MTMRLLDRYLIQKFLFVLFFASMAFIVIFIVVDLIEHLDKFLDSKAPFSRTVVYYLYYIPSIITLTLPVNMLLSSLFALGTMAQHNELVACMSAGVSLYRLVWPLLLVALLISILSGIANETVVPQANRTRLDIYEHEIRDRPREQFGTRRELSLQDRGERQLSIDYYNIRTQKANKVNIVWRDGNRIRERWDVKTMAWDSTRQAWRMSGITQRKFDPDEEISRLDTLWYEDSQILPGDLVDLDQQPEEMNYFELKRFVERMSIMGSNARKWIVDLHMKISYPLASFIIVLFGAPLASRKRRSGPALGFALALLISFVYFGFMKSGQVLGYNGTLPPWLGAWIGNIVFGVGGVVLMLMTRK